MCGFLLHTQRILGLTVHSRVLFVCCIFITLVLSNLSLFYFFVIMCSCLAACKKGKGNPYSITERRVPELFPVLGSQPAGDVSHKPGGRLPLFSVRLAVTLAILKRVTTNIAAW